MHWWLWPTFIIFWVGNAICCRQSPDDDLQWGQTIVVQEPMQMSTKEILSDATDCAMIEGESTSHRLLGKTFMK